MGDVCNSKMTLLVEFLRDDYRNVLYVGNAIKSTHLFQTPLQKSEQNQTNHLTNYL